jgi:hypothetical protein
MGFILEASSSSIFNLSIQKNETISIETGNFKLDGGAMFGVVLKTIWARTNPAVTII